MASSHVVFETETLNNKVFEEAIKAFTSEIRKSLDKISGKEDNKELREAVADSYYKRGVYRYRFLKNFVGGMYDLTLSLQWFPSSVYFFSRGDLFAKLEFYEQALADFQSSYELAPLNHNHIQLLRIKRLKEIIEQNN